MNALTNLFRGQNFLQTIGSKTMPARYLCQIFLVLRRNEVLMVARLEIESDCRKLI